MLAAIALGLTVLCAAPAKAPVAKAPSNATFEGMLTYKLGMPGGRGEMRTTISNLGVRTELVLDFNGQHSTTTVIVRAQDPQVSWRWHDGNKAFLPANPTRGPSRGPFKVDTFADEVVAGLTCRHVKLTDASYVTTEYWTATDFVKDGARARFLSTAQRLAPEVEEALKSAGAFGLIVKSVMSSNRSSTTFELDHIERVAIDPRAFDVTAK